MVSHQTVVLFLLTFQHESFNIRAREKKKLLLVFTEKYLTYLTQCITVKIKNNVYIFGENTTKLESVPALRPCSSY